MAAATKARPTDKPRARPRTVGERDRAAGDVELDDSLERRYHRQQQRARDRGEPTTMRELDRQERQETRAQARTEIASQFKVTNMPGGSLGVGAMMAPLIVETVLITADEFIRYKRWPVPSRFLAAFFIFGGLSLASGTQAAQAASLTAWGLVLATTYGFVSSSAGTNVLAGIGNFFGGSPTSTAKVTTTSGTPGYVGFTSTTAPVA